MLENPNFIPRIQQERMRPIPALFFTSGIIATITTLALYSIGVTSLINPELYHRVCAQTIMPLTIVASATGTLFFIDYIVTQIKGRRNIAIEITPEYPVWHRNLPPGTQDLGILIKTVMNNSVRMIEEVTNATSVHFNSHARGQTIRAATTLIHEINGALTNILRDINDLGQLQTTKDSLECALIATQRNLLHLREYVLPQLEETLTQNITFTEREKTHKEIEEIRKKTVAICTIGELQEEQERLEAQLAYLQTMSSNFLANGLEGREAIEIERLHIATQIEEITQLIEIKRRLREAKRLNDVREIEHLERLLHPNLPQKYNPLFATNQPQLKIFFRDLALSLENLLTTKLRDILSGGRLLASVGDLSLFTLLTNPVTQTTGRVLVISEEDLAEIINGFISKLFDTEVIRRFQAEAPSGRSMATIEIQVRKIASLFSYYLIDSSGFYRARVAKGIARTFSEIAEHLTSLADKEEDITIDDLNNLFTRDVGGLHTSFEIASKKTQALFAFGVIGLLIIAALGAGLPYLLNKITTINTTRNVALLILGASAFAIGSILLLKRYKWRHKNYRIEEIEAREERPLPPLPGIAMIHTDVETLHQRIGAILRQGEEQRIAPAEMVRRMWESIARITYDLLSEQAPLTENRTLYDFTVLEKYAFRSYYEKEERKLTNKVNEARAAYQHASEEERDRLHRKYIQAMVAHDKARANIERNIIEYFSPIATKDLAYFKCLPIMLHSAFVGIAESLTKYKSELQGRNYLFKVRDWITSGYLMVVKRANIKGSDSKVEACFALLGRGPEALPIYRDHLLAMKDKGPKIEGAVAQAKELAHYIANEFCRNITYREYRIKLGRIFLSEEAQPLHRTIAHLAELSDPDHDLTFEEVLDLLNLDNPNSPVSLLMEALSY